MFLSTAHLLGLTPPPAIHASAIFENKESSPANTLNDAGASLLGLGIFDKIRVKTDRRPLPPPHELR